MAMQREGFEPTKTSGQKQQKLQAEAGLQKQHGQNRQHQQQAQSQQQQEHTRKVKFCMYHLQGVCKFTADECLFAHSTEEMQRSRGARRKKADNTEKPKGGQSFLQDENLNTGACDWRLADPAATSEGVHGCSRDQNPPLRFEHMGHDDVSTNPQNQPGRWPILPEPMFVAPVGPMQPNMAKNKFPEGATDMQAPRAPPLNASAVAAAAAAAMGLVPGHPAAGWMAAAAVAGKLPHGYPLQQGLPGAGAGAMGLPPFGLPREQVAFGQNGTPAGANAPTSAGASQDIQELFRTIENLSHAIGRLAVVQQAPPQGGEFEEHPAEEPEAAKWPGAYAPSARPNHGRSPQAGKVCLTAPPGLTLEQAIGA